MPIMILFFILQLQSSTGPPAEQGRDFDPVPVGIGVALGFLVAIIIVTVIVAIMVVQRRRKRKFNAACIVQPSQGKGFTSTTGIYIIYYSSSRCLSM